MENILPNLAEFIPMFLAFCVIFFVLSKFAWPMISKTLDERQETIAESLESAEAAKVEGQRLLDEHKAEITAARVAATKSIEESNVAAEASRKEMLDAAKDAVTEIKARGQREADEMKRTVAADLTTSVADLSVEIASKLIGKNLGSAENKALVEKFVQESDFAREYGEVKKADGSTVAEVVTASALDDSTRALIVDKLTAAVGGPVTLKEIVKESVVGGISINIDGRMIDGTLASQLAAIKATMTKEA